MLAGVVPLPGLAATATIRAFLHRMAESIAYPASADQR